MRPTCRTGPCHPVSGAILQRKGFDQPEELSEFLKSGHDCVGAVSHLRVETN